MVCVFPAVFEELAFRGIIQVQFEKVVEPKVAILVASVLFSAAHFSFFFGTLSHAGWGSFGLDEVADGQPLSAYGGSFPS